LISSNQVSECIRRDKLSQNNYSLSSNPQEKLLTPSEVATLFRVDPKTVTRWAKAGKLNAIRTLGGHRRYKESEVKSLLKTTSNTNSGTTPNPSSNNPGGN
jgi:excisionase family DNA binding protein